MITVHFTRHCLTQLLVVVIVSNSLNSPTCGQEIVDEWKYTLRKPSANWYEVHYDDSSWKNGRGGFGSRGTPGARVNTIWHTNDIWLRKKLSLEKIPANAALLIHHDENAEVFLNGHRVAQFQGWLTDYKLVPLSDRNLKRLRIGTNHLAVHCHQTGGGQFIDVHVVDAQRVPDLPKPPRSKTPFQSQLMTKWGAEVTAENAWTEYPRPQLRRENWKNLNGNWEYAITTRGQHTIPDQWNGVLLVPYCLESKLGGVQRRLDESESLWYRRYFVSQRPFKRKTLLHFEAVDYECEVFVNGTSLGTHRGGNTPFSFDISAVLTQGKNELVVRVEDATERWQLRGKQALEPQGIWYTQVSGIWQTVWLEEVSLAYIEDLKISTEAKTGTIRINPRVVGEASRLKTLVKDQGKVVAEKTSSIEEIALVIEDPKLWSPASPHLYDLEVSLLDERGKVLDLVHSYTGIRTVGKRRDKFGHLRFTLNGTPLFHWGTLDQGWWPDGLLTPPSDEAMLFDIEYLKAAGFNMIRKHIKVEPRRYYYHCDRLGMLVWQDHVSGGKSPKWTRLKPNPADAHWPDDEHRQFRIELLRMVDALENHPSIVVWVPFNEAWGQHATLEMGELFHERDPSRLVNIASGGNFWPLGDIADAHKYPHPDFPFTSDEQGRFDDYIKVVGEFGGHGFPVAGHLWDKDRRNWGYGGLPHTLDEFKKRYETSLSKLRELQARGIAAGVYTQTTDVEGEINGLLTYDRKVAKLSSEELAGIHQWFLGRLETVESSKRVPHDSLPFADPNYHGSCDPEIVWNSVAEEWWVFYTARRANKKTGTYVGTPIGVAATKDMVNWRFLGYCAFDGQAGFPDNSDTRWAPGIIRQGDVFHMFVTYKDNANPPWGGKGKILHYEAPIDDLLGGWKKAEPPQFAQPDPIDATVIEVGDNYHAYYRVGKGGGIHWARSKDLKEWENLGKCLGDINNREVHGWSYQEAPYVFEFANSYWMLTDPHQGLAVYRSKDSITWKYQGIILAEPGNRPQDHTLARHPSVAVMDDRAVLCYHVEPNRPYPSPPPEKRTVEQKITFLQTAELKVVKNRLTCDRNKPIFAIGRDGASAHSATVHPNIILVFIDDLGWGDFSCFGNKEVETENIDHLAEEGLRFTQFYVNSPICSPSRVAITTGLYPQRCRIGSFLAKRRENERRGIANWLDPIVPTLPRLLKAEGYTTGHFGKWHMGGQRDVGEAPLIRDYGFDVTLTNFEGLGNRIIALIDRQDGKPPFKHAMGSHRLGRGQITYLPRQEVTQSFAQAAIEFIKHAEATDTPFYINLWPDDVHLPLVPPEDRRGNGSREALYRGVLDTMDEQLGELFTFVHNSDKLRNNTLILVCSDNGPAKGAGSTGGLRGQKAQLYEGGIRSPLIVWGPGLMKQSVQGNTNNRTVIAAMDLVPSLLQIANIATTSDTEFDGLQMQDQLLGRSTTVRETPLMFRRPPDRDSFYGVKDLPDLAIRLGPWKLLCEYDGSSAELYDLNSDAQETTNVAKVYPEIVKELTEQVVDWHGSLPHDLGDKYQATSN